MAALASIPEDLFVSPTMIVEIAQGAAPPEVIAARYGWDEERFRRLQSAAWFQREVESVRSRWNSDDALRARYRLMCEDLSLEAYREAKASDSFSQKFELAKWFAKMADMEPKSTLAATTNWGLTINVNGDAMHVAPAPPPPPVVESRAEPPSSLDTPAPSPPSNGSDPVADLTPLEPLLQIPDFSMANLSPLQDVLEALKADPKEEF